MVFQTCCFPRCFFTKLLQLTGIVIKQYLHNRKVCGYVQGVHFFDNKLRTHLAGWTLYSFGQSAERRGLRCWFFPRLNNMGFTATTSSKKNHGCVNKTRQRSVSRMRVYTMEKRFQERWGGVLLFLWTCGRWVYAGFILVGVKICCYCSNLNYINRNSNLCS